MTVLIAEPKDYSLQAIKLYRSLGSVVLSKNFLSEKKETLSKVNILIVRLSYKIDKSQFDKMPNLKIIASPTTGLNHIDIEEAKKRNIKIISLRGRTGFLKNISSTAEETIGLMLALIRNIPWAFDDVKAGNWNRDAWKGHQLLGKTIGIVGCGRLGKIVAKYAKALGMKILGIDPAVSEREMKKHRIEKVDMQTLLKKSDIVSLHVLLNDNNQNLIKDGHFKLMKPTAYLINTARGELIEKDSLFKALKNKWIAGAAIDVMRDEKGDSSHLKKDPLLEYSRKNKNLIVVPHFGGATYEAMQATEDFIAGIVARTVKI